MTETFHYASDGWRSFDGGRIVGTQDVGYVEGWGFPSFQDNFEGNELDTDAWRVNDRSTFGNLSYDWGNIQAGQVSVSGGYLRMAVTQRATPYSADGRDRWWDTPYIDTRGAGMHSALYGRWEIRCKNNTPVGTSRGIWPAFWLRNSSVGEIDLMEEWGTPVDTARVSSYKSGYSQFTFHESTNGGLAKAGYWTETEANKVDGTTRPANAGAFHVWTFERTPNYAALFHDGTQAVRVTPASHPWIWGPNHQQPWHMRLQVQMGDAYWTQAPVPSAQTQANSEFLVDYIRFWDYGG
ncbi:glycoside hydrolase family 16 protein [Paeniglutamicibacter terrestris]|uniref:Family 16 glycosylhydrolase n=1 Tax=Paeniglutamicibacter terrestris TaxID=2723403 RepID=A0ABX1G6S8_9MICC|nr:family 16 glycosylhydrolase [Paeniglutamicibacter terrestris]NKG21122.1 family 16 glycosylhydrolase [Paeniglutamicibacter terrestris]